MNKLAIIIGIIILGGVVALVARPHKQEQPASVSGNKAAEFVVVDYDGKQVKLSDFAGRPVFINFWASWCPFCLEEMPLMAKIQQEFGDQYATLAINRAERLDRAKQYSDQVGVTGKIILVLDEDDSVYRQFGYFAMPVSIFVDKDGIIRDVKQGPLSENELRNKIKALLQ
ncbi:MAG: TlpA family protein disulfide reductase [Candidatus Doudnabacteria bacterium]|nr:TlpA family protein disulfide reductase [Candidatus Doudnabacteria bacterium]